MISYLVAYAFVGLAVMIVIAGKELTPFDFSTWDGWLCTIFVGALMTLLWPIVVVMSLVCIYDVAKSGSQRDR